MKQNRIIGFMLALSWFICHGGMAQTPVFPEIKGWKLSPVQSYDENSLWEIINGAASSYLEYKFIELTRTEYTREDSAYIVAEAYEHATPAHAFGIYSREKSPSYNIFELGAQAYMTGSVLNFITGTYYVKIHSHSSDTGTIEAIKTIAGDMASAIDPAAKLPGELKYFPTRGKVTGSETFLSENILGRSFLNDAYMAKYKVGEHEFNALIFNKPTKKCQEMLKTYYEKTSKQDKQVLVGYHVIDDPYNGKVHLLWKDNRVFAIYNLEDAQLAREMLDEMEGLATSVKVK